MRRTTYSARRRRAVDARCDRRARVDGGRSARRKAVRKVEQVLRFRAAHRAERAANGERVRRRILACRRGDAVLCRPAGQVLARNLPLGPAQWRALGVARTAQSPGAVTDEQLAAQGRLARPDRADPLRPTRERSQRQRAEPDGWRAIRTFTGETTPSPAAHVRSYPSTSASSPARMNPSSSAGMPSMARPRMRERQRPAGRRAGPRSARAAVRQRRTAPRHRSGPRHRPTATLRPPLHWPDRRTATAVCARASRRSPAHAPSREPRRRSSARAHTQAAATRRRVAPRSPAASCSPRRCRAAARRRVRDRPSHHVVAPIHAHHRATTGSEQQGFETTRAAVSQLNDSAGGVHPYDRIDDHPGRRYVANSDSGTRCACPSAKGSATAKGR
jgi:hypothetical protein